MNEFQKKFIEYLKEVQNTNVEFCMDRFGCDDDFVRSMLFDVTFEVINDIMEMIDGCSDFSESQLDVVNVATGEHLKENPFLELHEQTELFLKEK